MCSYDVIYNMAPFNVRSKADISQLSRAFLGLDSHTTPTYAEAIDSDGVDDDVVAHKRGCPTYVIRL